MANVFNMILNVFNLLMLCRFHPERKSLIAAEKKKIPEIMKMKNENDMLDVVDAPTGEQR